MGKWMQVVPMDKPRSCVECGTEMDAGIGEADAVSEGDIIVCVECSAVHRLDASQPEGFRLLSEVDMGLLKWDEPTLYSQIRQALEALKVARMRGFI